MSPRNFFSALIKEQSYRKLYGVGGRKLGSKLYIRMRKKYIALIKYYIFAFAVHLINLDVFFSFNEIGNTNFR